MMFKTALATNVFVVVEIPANRYDCLCEEGLQLNLNVFLGRQSMPNFRVVSPPDGKCEVLKVDKSVRCLLPVFPCRF